MKNYTFNIYNNTYIATYFYLILTYTTYQPDREDYNVRSKGLFTRNKQGNLL